MASRSRPARLRSTASRRPTKQVDRDAQGRPLYLGYVVRFGNHSVYHPGDTVGHRRSRAATGPLRPLVGPIADQRPSTPTPRGGQSVGAGGRRRWPATSTPGSSCPATSTCSRSTPNRLTRSSPSAGNWASRTACCTVASGWMWNNSSPFAACPMSLSVAIVPVLSLA